MRRLELHAFILEMGLCFLFVQEDPVGPLFETSFALKTRLQ